MTTLSDDLIAPELRTPEAWVQLDCPMCSGGQMLVVKATGQDRYSSRPRVAWLRCVNCYRGVVINGRQISPPSMPLDVPEGVDGDALKTWNEARACLGVGAYTASVMMCRKLLMHMAVEEGLPEKNDKGYAPNFVQCMDHLQAEGVITKRNRDWADKIKDIGNEANHDLASIDKAQATSVATFTRQLLHEVYELPFLAAKS